MCYNEAPTQHPQCLGSVPLGSHCTPPHPWHSSYSFTLSPALSIPTPACLVLPQPSQLVKSAPPSFPKAHPSLQAAPVSPICVPWRSCAQVLCLALWAAVLPGGGLGSPSFHAAQSPPRARHSVCPENIYFFLWRLWTWARKVSLKDSVDSVQPIPELRPRTPRGALGPKSEAVESLFGCDCNQPDGMLTSVIRMAVKGEGGY